MKLRLILASTFTMLTVLVFAQATAKVQVIHNSPTPTVDIYANGTKLLDNFAFRNATPYIDVPAGVTINLGVGLATSASVRDTLVNIPVVLQANRTYVVIASGVVGNATRPFRLAVTDMGTQTASTPTNVGIAFFHGAPDAPAVDVRTGGNVVFGNTAYGSFGRVGTTTAAYANVPANATYNLQVTPAGATAVVAAYEANLSFWAGKTVVICASGFLGSEDPNDKFEAFVALSNGGTFPLKTVQAVAPPRPTNTAFLQIIHNSPTPTVDIYVNGAKLLDDLAYRNATPYISVPAGVALSVAVAPASSRTVADAIATFPVRLDSGKTYIAVAHGIVGNTQRPFSIAISDAGRRFSTSPSNVDIGFFHGSPDAPNVNILAGNSAIFTNVAYSRFGAYVSVPAEATYRLGVAATATPTNILARYDANLGFWKGKTAVVIATGFLGAGSATPFQPWVVLSNGGTFPLTAVTGFDGDITEQLSSRVPFTQNTEMTLSPNPASSVVTANISLAKDSDVKISVIDVTGRVAQYVQFDNLSRGVHQLDVTIKDLKSGYYIVRTESADGVVNKKLLVTK
jgi:Domain of unknown function (DUF4397)/Secretion system C-terminal sorting domain